MKNEDIERLRRLTNFEDLVAYLRDELDWPIEVEDADEITFDYDPAELGIAPLHALYASFKEALLHDLTPEAFADMVAQTVAYGLFSAATQTGDGPAPGLGFDTVVEQIPNTNPFLKDLLAELTSEGAVDLEELGVDLVALHLLEDDYPAASWNQHSRGDPSWSPSPLQLKETMRLMAQIDAVIASRGGWPIE